MDTLQQRIDDEIKRKTGKLDLSRLDLQDIPSQVSELTWLKELDISSNSIRFVSKDILSKLTNLEDLDISNNEFSEIPHFINSLNKLKYFQASGNKIQNCPSLDWPSTLLHLHLDNNELTFFSTPRVGLDNLSLLSLKSNQLNHIPEFIYELNNLYYLFLSNNKIESILKNIGNLLNLRQFHIDNNKLKALPEEFNELKSLNRYFNQPQLDGLYLHQNEFDVPPELFQNEPKTVIDYILDVQNKEDYIDETKLIFLGDPYVGKTTIKNLLLGRGIEQESGQTTLEIDSFHLDQTKYNIWDFGGQRSFEYAHSTFLTNRSIYVIVLTSRTSDVAADPLYSYLGKIVEHVGTDVPIILLYNKSDDGSNIYHIPTVEELQRSYPSVVRVEKVTAKKNPEFCKNVLHSALKEAKNNLKHISDKYRKPIIDLKNDIEAREENFITKDVFDNICDKVNVKNDEKETAISLLNDLGILLHFNPNSKYFEEVKTKALNSNGPDKDESEKAFKALEQIKILKPKWISTIVYNLLNNKILDKKGGKVTIEEIQEILSTVEDSGIQSTLEFSYLVVGYMRINKLISLYDKKYIFTHALPPGSTPWDHPDSDTLEARLNFRTIHTDNPVEPKGYLNDNFQLLMNHHLGENSRETKTEFSFSEKDIEVKYTLEEQHSLILIQCYARTPLTRKETLNNQLKTIDSILNTGANRRGKKQASYQVQVPLLIKEKSILKQEGHKVWYSLEVIKKLHEKKNLHFFDDTDMHEEHSVVEHYDYYVRINEKSVEANEIISSIRRNLSNGEIEHCFEGLQTLIDKRYIEDKDFSDYFMHIKSRYEKIKKEHSLNLVVNDEFWTIRQKTIASLSELIDDAKKIINQ